MSLVIKIHVLKFMLTLMLPVVHEVFFKFCFFAPTPAPIDIFSV
jgi:hypothetical protein